MIALPTDFLTRPLAHRALHDINDGRPENSRAAIRAAIAAGYGIEMDLQLSSDGQAMVFHDYELSRLTTADGPFAVNTAAELGAIQLRHGSEGIPTLTEILDLVNGQVPLLIEIKDQDGMMGENIGPLGAATAKALENYSGLVALMSFNPNAVAEMANLLPNIPRGITSDPFVPADNPTLPPRVCEHLRQIPDYTRTRSSFISHQAADLSSPRVAELKSAGANVLCWTIRSAAEETKAREVAENVTFEGYLA